MTNLQPLLERNKTFAETGAHQGLAPQPRHDLFVVSCIDGRVDPAHILGADVGDALVMRNSGGSVTDEVIADVAFIATLTETLMGDDAPGFEVAVIHHSGCGTGFLADDSYRTRYAERVGGNVEELVHVAVVDPAATVADDVARLVSAPSVPSMVSVSGHVYDINTGLVTTVVKPTAAGS